MAERPCHSFSRKITLSKGRSLGSLRAGRSWKVSHNQHHTLFTFLAMPDIDSRISRPHLTAPCIEIWSGSDDYKLDVTETEIAIQAAVCTIVQLRPDEQGRVEMIDYICKVFSLSPYSFEERRMIAAEKLKKSGVTLSCTLINYEQEDVPSDANSSFNWFCVIGVLSDEHISSKAVKKDNLEDWKEQNLVDKVFTSSIHPRNKTIELPVHNLSDGWLVIEVWNKDSGQSRLQKIRKTAKECNFVGRAFFRLQNMSSQLEMRRFELLSHSAKSKRGSIKCCISIKRTDVVNMLLSERLGRHRALLSAVVLHECFKQTLEGQEGSTGAEERSSAIVQWDTQLNLTAKSLLRLHAELCSLSEFHQVALQFSVLFNCRKCCKYLLQQPALEMLVDNITRLSQSVTPSDEGETKLRSELFKNLQDFLTILVNPVNDHLVALDIKDPSSIARLKNNLILIQKLYSNRPFISSLPQSFPQTFDFVVETAIKKSTTQWCTSLLTDCAKLAEQAEYKQINTVDPLRVFAKSCLNQCQMVQNYLLPLFQEFQFNYFNPFLQSFDEQLHTVAAMIDGIQMDSNQSRRDQTLVSLYEVYITFQQIKTFCNLLDTSIIDAPKLRRSYLWFEPFVLKWMKLALARCKDRITIAVKDDKVVKVTDEVDYSSSLVDAVTFLTQMVEFWKNLDWPHPDQSYGFLRFLVTNIIDAVLYYVDLIYQKSLSIGMATATAELCIVLNNMQEMRNRLGAKDGVSLMEELHLERFFAWLDQSATNDLGSQARVYVQNLLDNAVEDVGNKIIVLTEQLGENFNSSIKQQLQEVTKEAKDGSPKETTASIQSLERYLDSNLSTLSENLFYEVFRLLLTQVWTATVRAMLDLTMGQRMQWRTYDRIYETLKSLKSFFHAGGEGLPDADLETQEYNALFDCLRRRRLPTEKMILQYCESLAEDQAPGGDLTFSAAYVNNQVELTLIEMNAVPPPTVKDRLVNDYAASTLCAQLFLLPEGYDPTHSAQSGRAAQRRTKSRSAYSSRQLSTQDFQTLTETMCLYVKNRYDDGTIVVISVYQRPRNVRGKNEFIGTCTVCMKQITDTKQRFPLHFLQPRESLLFSEILSRREYFQDKTATIFIESMAAYSMLPTNCAK